MTTYTKSQIAFYNKITINSLLYLDLDEFNYYYSKNIDSDTWKDIKKMIRKHRVKQKFKYDPYTENYSNNRGAEDDEYSIKAYCKFIWDYYELIYKASEYLIDDNDFNETNPFDNDDDDDNF